MEMTQQGRRPVSIKALEARVRRRLAREGETLHKCRPGSQWHRDLGDYYAADDRNHLVRTHIDLAEVAAEFGLIGAREVVNV